MSIVGLITEYNPFHLGHLYHLKNSKFLTKSEYSISIMSGNFLQRGEPAMLDKWSRAKMAVQNGVDLVIELPFLYSSQSAEIFASGAVKILDSLNVVDYLCFGSEEGSTDILSSIADILVEEPKEYRLLLKDYLSRGLSFPSSRHRALIDYMGTSDLIGLEGLEQLDRVLSSPNNILGIEYIKSLKKINSHIRPETVHRISSNYNDQSLRKKISSATAIRNTFFQTRDIDSIEDSLSKLSFEIMSQFLYEFNDFNRIENFSDMIFYSLLNLKHSKLSEKSDIMDLDDDLQNRMLNSLANSDNLSDLINNLKTRRYTRTRINRALVNLMLGVKRDDVFDALNSKSNYIRVLASNKKGFEILKKIKAKSDTYVINKISDLRNIDDSSVYNMIEYDIKSTDLYYLGLKSSSKALHQNQDFLRSPYIEK